MPVVSEVNEISEDAIKMSVNKKGDEHVKSPESAVTRVSAIPRLCARLRRLTFSAGTAGAGIVFRELVRLVLSQFLGS